MTEGTIVKSLSGFYYVKTAHGLITCRARGRLRHDHIKPLVGDRVILTQNGAEGTVDEILPRKNEFARPPVANIDRLVLIVSKAIPVADTFLMDRMIAVAEHYGVEPVICINKCDIERGDDLFAVYSAAGFRVIMTSAFTGEGIEELRAVLTDGISAFAGNSGVGKSSILNALCPDMGLQTGEVSEKLGRGRHTTRHVELYSLPDGALIADTPGFSMFDTDGMGFLPEDIQYMFRDFAPYIGQCSFTGCSHVAEKGCGVLRALRDGEIRPTRHASYAMMYAEARSHKQWELKNK